MYSYGQCHTDDVLENYIKWYSYFDDSTLAVESYHQAHEQSMVYINVEVSEDELKDVREIDIDEIRHDFKLKLNSMYSEDNIKW